MALSGQLQRDSDGDKFVGPADPQGILGYAFRGANAHDGLADQIVVLYDENEQPLLVAANPGVVRLVPGQAVAIDQSTPGTTDRVHAVQVGRWSIQAVDDAGATIGTEANPTWTRATQQGAWATRPIDDAGLTIGTQANPIHVRQRPAGYKVLHKASVATQAVQVVPAETGRHATTLVNAGSRTVYLGPSGVTIATGLPLPAGQSYVDRESADAWFGVTDAQTSEIRALSVLPVAGSL